ncbi:11912_t:CDS:2, partial [Acaulospora colombiana]
AAKTLPKLVSKRLKWNKDTAYNATWASKAAWAASSWSTSIAGSSAVSSISAVSFSPASRSIAARIVWIVLHGSSPSEYSQQQVLNRQTTLEKS